MTSISCWPVDFEGVAQRVELFLLVLRSTDINTIIVTTSNTIIMPAAAATAPPITAAEMLLLLAVKEYTYYHMQQSIYDHLSI